MFASAMALLLPTAFSPTLNVAFWTPKYVLLPLLAAVGLPRLPSLLRGSTTRKPAACALAFLAWA
ncbi:MAG: hypothetical protein AVDCRST_MAG50-1230, partial [uncultured Acidimicrobiales bacterium]